MTEKEYTDMYEMPGNKARTSRGTGLTLRKGMPEFNRDGATSSDHWITTQAASITRRNTEKNRN
jgi:hypothetical protein